ncbi:hypothetical protein DFH06DRAFT_566918 [Mycena polygramma]|nr:hypothetical protein DFH06DRAFT_566918 [Mycena polygramma]
MLSHLRYSPGLQPVYRGKTLSSDGRLLDRLTFRRAPKSLAQLLLRMLMCPHTVRRRKIGCLLRLVKPRRCRPQPHQPTIGRPALDHLTFGLTLNTLRALPQLLLRMLIRPHSREIGCLLRRLVGHRRSPPQPHRPTLQTVVSRNFQAQTSLCRRLFPRIILLIRSEASPRSRPSRQTAVLPPVELRVRPRIPPADVPLNNRISPPPRDLPATQPLDWARAHSCPPAKLLQRHQTPRLDPPKTPPVIRRSMRDRIYDISSLTRARLLVSSR